MSGTKSFFYENAHFDYNYSVNASWENSPTSFPTHWHTFGEIVCAASDHSIFEIQGKTYTLQKGDILFVWPGELHSTIQAEPRSHLIVQYYNQLLNTFSDMSFLHSQVLSRHYVSCSAQDSPAAEIARYMYEIRDIFHVKVPMVNTRMCLSLYHILLLFYDCCSAGNLSASAESGTARIKAQQAIANACCYISEHCDQDLSLKEVADFVGLSKFHFSRSFHEYTQSSFSDYVAKQRIQQAILLFENRDISIAEIAFQSGFGSIASFNRCFKKEKKCTPSEYRDLMLNP